MNYYYYPYQQRQIPYLVVPDAKKWEGQLVDLQMKSTGRIYKNAYITKVVDTPGASYGSVTFIPSGQNLPLSTEAADILFIGPPGSIAAPQPTQPTQPTQPISPYPSSGWGIPISIYPPRPPYPPRPRYDY